MELASYFENIRIRIFPQREFRKYGQVVMLGTGRQHRLSEAGKVRCVASQIQHMMKNELTSIRPYEFRYKISPDHCITNLQAEFNERSRIRGQRKNASGDIA